MCYPYKLPMSLKHTCLGSWIINLNHCSSVGTLHVTSLQRELHLIKSAILIQQLRQRTL